jgi:hypothetical protein
VRIAGVQEPAQIGERSPLDQLADKLDTEAAAAVVREDVDVREVGDRRPVREGACKRDLALAVVDADDAVGLADEAVNGVARPSLRPVRVVGEVVVDGVDVDARRVVVELEPVAEGTPHR